MNMVMWTLFVIINISLMVKIYFNIVNELDEIKKYKKLNAIMKKKWLKCEAIITDLGINVDYNYPGLIPDTSFCQTEQEKSIFLREFFQDQYHQGLLINLHKGSLIEYQYSSNGELITGRDIGLIPDTKDMQIVRSLKIGDKIQIFVNPNDEMQSFIRGSSNSLFKNYQIKRLLSFLPVVSIITVLWLIIILGLFIH